MVVVVVQEAQKLLKYHLQSTELFTYIIFICTIQMRKLRLTCRTSFENMDFMDEGLDAKWYHEVR